MARQILILALIFFAIVGMASAAATTAAEHATSSEPVEGPSDVIGTTDGSDHDAAPVGGPVPNGAFPTDTGTDAPTEAATKSGASALLVSAGAGVGVATSVAAVAFFF